MKKIYIAIAAILFAAASVATVLAVRSHNRMDDFFRANVDALVNSEELHPEGYVRCYHNTYDDGSAGYYLQVRKCFDCNDVDATSVSKPDTCMP